jgi:hypothetical protein
MTTKFFSILVAALVFLPVAAATMMQAAQMVA